MLRPKKNSYKEFDIEKNSCGSKIPYSPHKFSKGRTIRKVMGGGAGEVQKKNSCKGKLREKKIHACRVDQEKNSCIGLSHSSLL